MAKDKEKVGIGALFLAILALLFFWKKKPPEPPPEGKATLWGIVTDASTGSPIEGIVASLNSWSYTTGTDGRYEFPEVEPGTYSLVFTDPLGRYESLTI